jgi:hypothetical protein
LKLRCFRLGGEVSFVTQNVSVRRVDDNQTKVLFPHKEKIVTNRNADDADRNKELDGLYRCR